MKERRELIDLLVDFVYMDEILLFYTYFTSDWHLVDERVEEYTWETMAQF